MKNIMKKKVMMNNYFLFFTKIKKKDKLSRIIYMKIKEERKLSDKRKEIFK